MFHSLHSKFLRIHPFRLNFSTTWFQNGTGQASLIIFSISLHLKGSFIHTPCHVGTSSVLPPFSFFEKLSFQIAVSSYCCSLLKLSHFSMLISHCIQMAYHTLLYVTHFLEQQFYREYLYGCFAWRCEHWRLVAFLQYLCSLQMYQQRISGAKEALLQDNRSATPHHILRETEKEPKLYFLYIQAYTCPLPFFQK